MPSHHVRHSADAVGYGILRLSWVVFSSLRLYAILNRSAILPGLILVLGLVPVAINIVSLCLATPGREEQLTLSKYTFSRTSVSYVEDPVIGPYCNYALQLPHMHVF